MPDLTQAFAGGGTLASSRRLAERIRTLRPNAWVVFVAAAVVYIATGTYGGVQSNDTQTAALAAWALGAHHSLNLAHVAAVVNTPKNTAAPLWIFYGAHGWLVSNRFPGAIVMAAPLYAISGSGLSWVPATIAAALAAAGACALLYKVLRRLHGSQLALAGAGAFAFATSNWTVSGRELWEHPGAELMIAAGMLAFLSRRWAWSGLAFGATILFRPHLGFGVAVMCLGILWIERRWRPTIIFAVSAIPGLAGFLAWEWLLFGRITTTGYSDITPGGKGPLDFLDNIAGTLVSPQRGLLICSPIILIAVLGVRQAWRESPRSVRVFTLAGLAYLASQLWLIRYSGGSGFLGYRTDLETLLWCAPLLVSAGAIGTRKLGGNVTWILAAISVAFFAGGAFVKGETLGDVNAWTTYGLVPFAQQYGTGKVLLGVAIGTGAVFAAWGVTRPRSKAIESTGLGAPASADLPVATTGSRTPKDL